MLEGPVEMSFTALRILLGEIKKIGTLLRDLSLFLPTLPFHGRRESRRQLPNPPQKQNT
jgi:hypothetical protein